jgi:hypothetical protein
MFLQERADARARQDAGVERCMNVELARMGYQEPLETTAQQPMQTTLQEKPRRGRPPKPRCEHDMLVGRCPDCSEDAI